MGGCVSTPQVAAGGSQTDVATKYHFKRQSSEKPLQQQNSTVEIEKEAQSSIDKCPASGALSIETLNVHPFRDRAFSVLMVANPAQSVTSKLERGITVQLLKLSSGTSLLPVVANDEAKAQVRAKSLAEYSR